MKTKTICGFVVALTLMLFAMNYVIAASLAVDINEVSVNDVELGSGVTLAGYASETVPVVVKFDSNKDLSDLKVKVWIEGYKSDISASTARFNVLNGSTYIKRLSLTLPSVEDMDDLNEPLTLYVRIADRTDAKEQSYNIEMQRDSYSAKLLSVEMPSKASAGEIIALNVVLKNTGAEELEDTFVTASIPELGVSKKVYFGDVTPEDCMDGDDCEKEDARERNVYLIVPADAKSGDYTVEVKASNYDTTSTVKKVITITGLAADTKDDKGNVITSGNKEAGIPTSIIVLTVVLVIIFVVLLIVLIVLLTKKPSEKSEDFGETSYY